MKILYLVAVHKNPDQLQRLISALEDEHTYFIIHIDQKSQFEDFRKVKCKLEDNLYFTKNRYNITWGGVSQIKATLELIDNAFSQKISFDFATFISGQDFPIVPQHSIRAFFQKYPDINFLECTKLPYSGWQLNGGIDRVNYYWFVDRLGPRMANLLYRAQKVAGLRKRKIAFSTLYGGSSWWSINRKCLEFIHRNAGKDSEYFKYYENTFCADEIYFQTFLMNSSFRDTIENNNLRYIDWNKGPQFPRVLDSSDYESVIMSGKHFARKFEEGSDLLQMLEKNVRTDA
jgi:hypothetical protein